MQDIFSAENFRKQGHQLVDRLANYLLEVPHSTQAIPWLSPEQSLIFWQNELDFKGNKNPMDFFEAVLSNSVKIHHPCYMGHQVGMVAPTAALAGLLTGLLNNGMAVYEMGMSSIPLEQVICKKLAQLFGLPETAGGFMTSGGTVANITAMLTARQLRAGRDIWTQGQQSEKMAIMVSEEAHYCMSRAAQIMGWGEAGVIKIPTENRFKINVNLLESYYQTALGNGIRVIALVGSACSTALGAFDDLQALADFAKAKQLWFHVDAAHGGAAILSPKYAHLLEGIEKADSITIDFHKMMMVPALASAIIFKQESDSMQTFAQQADYLLSAHQTNWHNPAARTFECSKFMMSVKVAALIQEHGLEKIGEYVEKCFDNGKKLAEMIRRRPVFELAHEPECNIVCFRFLANNTPETDLINEKVCEKLLHEGKFYILKTKINGRVFFRLSLMNVFSSQTEFESLLNEIENTAKALNHSDT